VSLWLRVETPESQSIRTVPSAFRTNLGIVNPENDVIYLPLRAGRNELMLAVAELGGGWGFVARLESMGP
jgi:hypothetical protein